MSKSEAVHFRLEYMSEPKKVMKIEQCPSAVNIFNIQHMLMLGLSFSNWFLFVPNPVNLNFMLFHCTSITPQEISENDDKMFACNQFKEINPDGG